MREGRWVIADMRGKGGRVRTVAVPLWIKQGINTWLAAAELEDGRLLRAVGKSGKVLRCELSDWAIWISEIQMRELSPAQSAADEQSKDDIVPLPFQGRPVPVQPEVLSLVLG